LSFGIIYTKQHDRENGVYGMYIKTKKSKNFSQKT